MKDLLAQREAIARKKQEIDALRLEEEQERERVRLQARERVLTAGTASLFGKRKEREESGISKEDDEPASKKRKFEFDAEAAKKVAQEAEDEAIRQLELEQNEARKSKLPAFWLPSLTPESSNRLPSLKDVKLQTMCHVAEPSHPLLMKHLVPVSFTLYSSKDKSSSNDEKTKICPSCQKQLSNTTQLFLMKPCNHVICKTCTESLVKPANQCVVCDATLGSKDIIEMLREGTGFAGGGRAETSKAGTAFQG